MEETARALSIVVCTHNRLAHLQDCLASLACQSAEPGDFEVLVVDNASSDGTAGWARSFCAERPGFRYLREDRLGLSAARNAGQEAAQGRYVAFIDDDAEAFPDWVARLVAAFETIEPAPDAVGGEIEPVWGAPLPQWMDELFMRFLAAGLHWSSEAIFLQPPQWICEVNSAYRSEALRRYGPWPEDLGRKGTSLLSNENLINQRIYADGGRIYFDPAIRVRHHIHGHRLTKQWMRRRHFWQGISEARIVQGHPEVTWPLRWQEPWRPASKEEWDRLFDDARPDAEFRATCHRIYQIGFQLQTAGLIDGR